MISLRYYFSVDPFAVNHAYVYGRNDYWRSIYMDSHPFVRGTMYDQIMSPMDDIFIPIGHILKRAIEQRIIRQQINGGLLEAQNQSRP
jgi:hypothetical protein